MARPDRLSAIVLGAGLSRRFGSNKLLADLGGKTLLQRSIEGVLRVAPEVGIGEIFLVLPPGSMPGLELGSGISVVEAADHRAGLAQSLRAGMAAVDRQAGGVFLFLADMPIAPSAMLLTQLIDRLADRDAARPVWRGRPGHPVLFGRRLLGRLARLRGDKGARALLGPDHCAWVEAESDNVLFDVDEPLDLAEAYCRLGLS